MEAKPTYTIRPPWPDEEARVNAFLRAFKPTHPYTIRIAVTGPWERIIGVAAKANTEAESEVWLKLRPKYIDTDLGPALRDSFPRTLKD
jgi:hypothetical protein